MPVGLFRLLSGGAAPIHCRAGPWRALYVERGAVQLTPGDTQVRAGDGRALGRGGVSCIPAVPQTRLWLWEWAADAADPEPEGATLALAHDVSRYVDEPEDVALLRMEEVALHPGAETARHTHAGCGLRVLVSGHIDAEVGDRRLSLEPGDCWLERGPEEPVIGRSGDNGGVFVRVMVLPGDMQGQDSYRPWGDDVDRRGRPASYRKFFEMKVT